MAFVGECSQDLPIKVSPDLIRKGLLVSGNWLYNMQDYEGVMQVIAESPLIDKLISHVMPMSKIQEGFRSSGCWRSREDRASSLGVARVLMIATRLNLIQVRPMVLRFILTAIGLFLFARFQAMLWRVCDTHFLCASRGLYAGGRFCLRGC